METGGKLHAIAPNVCSETKYTFIQIHLAINGFFTINIYCKLGKKRNATKFTVVSFSLLITGLVVLGDSFIRHVIDLFDVNIF